MSPHDGTTRQRRARPAHQRLSEALRARLLDGEFANGDRLPTEAELEQQYGLSRQTARRAFLDLVAEGLVRRHPGRGTFATHVGTPRYARTVGSIDELMEWGSSELEIDQQISLRSEPESADLLELDSPVVAFLRYRRTFSGAVFGITEVALPPSIGQELIEAVPSRTACAQSYALPTGASAARSPACSRPSTRRPRPPRSPPTSGYALARRCCSRGASSSIRTSVR